VTAVIVAVAIIVVGGVATVAYLRSVRGRPRSISADIERFQSSLDALRPRAAERRDAEPGTMEDPVDGDG
jgi:hypothetical protein